MANVTAAPSPIIVDKTAGQTKGSSRPSIRMCASVWETRRTLRAHFLSH